MANRTRSSIPNVQVDGTTPLITVRHAIPGYESAGIVEVEANPNMTWTEFFRQNQINLDETQYHVKCSKSKGMLGDKIKVMLDLFVKKNKLHIEIEKIGNGKRCRKRIGDKNEAGRSQTTSNKKPKRENGTGTVNDGELPSTSQAARAKAVESRNKPKKFFKKTGRGPYLPRTHYPEDDFDSDSNVAIVNDGGTTSSHRNGMHNGRNVDFADDLSSISTDDDANDQDIQDESEIKQHFIRFLDHVPNSELVKMRQELLKLKESGSERVYKFCHYAPKTCCFLFALFKLP